MAPRFSTVRLSELGTNCWSARRLVGACHRCDRYDRCRYPERVPNTEFDAVRAEARRLRKESDDLYRKLKEI